MKKDIKVLILIFAIGVALMVTSCKKNDPPTRSQMLIGTWQVTGLYQDYNNNGIADSDEIVQDTMLSHEWFSFYANGRMSVAYYSNFNGYRWVLASNNTYLHLMDTFSFSNNYYHIDTLTSTTLVLKDTTGASYGGTSWTTLAKI